ncbi:MAG: HD domain-containing protein [Pseudomonadota bacterium]|nr:MAG: HD domain-containing protein [Pseudomonadota bacterium]
MLFRNDPLDKLNRRLPLAEKLRHIHDALSRRHSFVDRIAVALYDAKINSVKTFAHSSGTAQPLAHYETGIENAASLKEIIDKGQPRVVNDLGEFADGQQTHTLRIAEQGYASSYTTPMYVDGTFFGFIFFNSYEKAPFDDISLDDLDLFAHLVSLLIINELRAMQVLLATVKTARDMSHQRDFETGSHLDRMSHFARLIARELAAHGEHRLSDEYIERVFAFSPLHDVGKIAIPDRVLLKPGRLDDEELRIMRTHALKGREMIDQMLANFQLGDVQSVDILRNIAEYHHEAYNGSGYPHGLAGEEIPLEARIVAVADMFDALTSRRPYKHAWSNDEAFETLHELASVRLDPACVAALSARRSEAEAIQARFGDSCG